MDKNCIFCRVVNGDEKADVIYEDEIVMAFMDIAPVNPGHVLVIPKEHYVSAVSIPEQVAGRMFYIASRVAVACKRILDTDGFNMHLADGFCAGQEIPHSHIHLIPRSIDDNFHWNWRKLELEENYFSELADDIRKKLKLS